MVSAYNLLNYQDWKDLYTARTDGSDKQLGAVIRKNNKPIILFSIILSKPHMSYTGTDKETLYGS